MPIDGLLLAVIIFDVFVVAYLIWLFLTPKGKAYRAKNKALAVEKAKLVSEGKYTTPSKSRVAYFFSGVVMITAFSFLFGTVLAGIDPFLFGDMELLSIVVGIVVGSIFSLLAIAIATTAEQKGRSFDAFFLLSIIFSPLIMGIIAISLSPSSANKSNVSTSITTPDVAEQIKKLNDLMAQGILTKEEFELKKKQLLERI